MTETTITMHREFLKEIGRKRAALQEELRLLDVVEKYHAQQLNETNGLKPRLPVAMENSSSGVEQPEPEPAPDTENTQLRIRLASSRKWQAAQIALENLARPSRIGDLIDFLYSYGYGSEMKRRILHNSLHTAMDRRKDVFTKVRKGVWTLKTWDNMPPKKSTIPGFYD